MKTVIDMAAEAGFDVDLQSFKDGTAIALRSIEIAQREEREACAKVCEAKAKALGERADLCDDDEDAIELKARAWQMVVLAAELRERSNA